MFLAVWWRRLWLFVRRDHARRELEEEMQLHRDLRARSLERDGLTSSDATATARRQFGHAPTIAERSQESWGFNRTEELRANVRYALRRLRTRPAYSAAIITVMGLGIGATTAMFSAVDAAMLRALPFREPERLVSLRRVELPFASGPASALDVRSALNLSDVAAMPEMFSSVAAYAAGRLNLRDAERPLRVRAGVVTTELFRTLGVPAATGRTFAAEEGVPGNGAVVILSDALWRRQYGAGDVLEKTILLDDQPYRVVGVMPPRFSFPEESDLWIPMSVPNTRATMAAFSGYIPWEVVARLTPGMEIDAANTRLLDRWARTVEARAGATETREMREQWIADLRSNGAVKPLQTYLSSTRARALLVLMGASALLLLIACANVTNLLLSDAATRTREMSLRTALGASRGRVFRHVLTESTVLALGGIVMGMLVTPIVLRVLQALMPVELAGVAAPRIDWRVLAFASSLGLLTGVGFGLAPARRATRSDPAETLKTGGDRSATGRRSGRASRILITAEIALSLMLLIGSGLLLRTFAHLMNVDRGMDTANVASLELSFDSETTGAVRITQIEAILERVRRAPGVESAAAVNDLPLSSANRTSLVLAPAVGQSGRPGGARNLQVSADYFRTLGIPLIKGRDFTSRDDSTAAPTVIVNEALARRWFPNVDPIGRQLSPLGASAPLTVVGLVGDVREVDLDTNASPQLYRPVYRVPPTTFALVARGRASSVTLLAELRGAVRAVDPSQAVGRARMMDEVVQDSVASRRTNALLISVFAALAVVLAAFGVYSVVAHSVAQRRREFGIRTTLGATGRDLVAMVSREMLLLVTLGIAIGLTGAWMGVRVLEAMVYGVTVHDPTTFAVGPVTLALVAMTAAILPLRRVFSVDPVDVVRSD